MRRDCAPGSRVRRARARACAEPSSNRGIRASCGTQRSAVRADRTPKDTERGAGAPSTLACGCPARCALPWARRVNTR